MSSNITLIEFIPGTKAKAEDVNANFSTLKDAIGTKASIEGDISQTFEVATATASAHAVRKEQLDTEINTLSKKVEATSSRFCIKSGNTDSGVADLISYSGLSVSFKIGGSYPNLKALNVDGDVIEITSAASIDMTGKSNGTYNIFLKPDGGLYTQINKIYRQADRPSLLEGDIWLDISLEPITAIKYTNANDEAFIDVPLGSITIASSAISSVSTFPYNQNGYELNLLTKNSAAPYYAGGVSKTWSTTHAAEADGHIKYTCVSRNVAAVVYMYFNGVQTRLFQNTSAYGIAISGMLAVAKGDTYHFTGGEEYILTFYPMKGGN